MVHNRYLAILVLSITLIACSNSKNEDKFLNDASKTIDASTTIIESSSRRLLLELNSKHNDNDSDVCLATKKIYPKAELLSGYCNAICKYMDSLKFLLKGNTDVDALIIKGGIAVDLYKKQQQHKANLLSIDTSWHSLLDFGDKYIMTSREFDSLPESKKDFPKFFFENVSVAQAKFKLSQFQNNVRLFEHSMMEYCLSRTVIFNCGLWSGFSIIFSPNRRTFVAKEEFTIVVIINRSQTPLMKFWIDGKLVDNHHGTAIGIVKASSQIGKHQVPIKVEYTDVKSGKIDASELLIDYSVVTPKEIK